MPPQEPVAVKVKGLLTDAPPAASTPYDCGALGEMTPLFCNNVATRLVVLLEPVFLRENNIVTVSPGSTALLVGMQFSWTRVVLSATTTVLAVTTTVKVLVALRCCIAGGAEELKSVTTVVKRLVVWP